MLFAELNIIRPIQKALNDEGYISATLIQEKVIPVALEGRDLLGCAQTGTGKTAAFAIPILQQIFIEKNNNKGVKGPRTISAVILAPTRELAVQIGNSFKAYSCYMNMKVKVVLGGVPKKTQIKDLKEGADILIASPGRLLDLINEKVMDLNEVKYFILDEVDRMLHMGMVEDVRAIMENLPKERQNMVFSATMPEEILELLGTILKKPSKIEVSPVSSIGENINQGVYFVDKENKKNLLIKLLRDNDISSTIVFLRTKHEVDNLFKELKGNGIKVDCIHGDKSQVAREKALNNFKEGRVKVLVATDVASRGIDVERLECVINYHVPNSPETYIHRIGRTGRAQNTGVSYTFCDIDERKMLCDIEKLIGNKIATISDNPYPAKNFKPSHKTTLGYKKWEHKKQNK